MRGGMVDGKEWNLPTLVQWPRTCLGCSPTSCRIDPIEFFEISDIFIQRDHAISNIPRLDQVDVRTVRAATYHSAGGTVYADMTGRAASHGDKWWVVFTSCVNLTLQLGEALSVVLENTTVLKSLVRGRSLFSVDVIMILLITIVVGWESWAVSVVYGGRGDGRFRRDDR